MLELRQPPLHYTVLDMIFPEFLTGQLCIKRDNVWYVLHIIFPSAISVVHKTHIVSCSQCVQGPGYCSCFIHTALSDTTKQPYTDAVIHEIQRKGNTKHHPTQCRPHGKQGPHWTQSQKYLLYVCIYILFNRFNAVAPWLFDQQLINHTIGFML